MTMSTTTSRMVAPRPQASSTVYLGATTEYKNKQRVTVKKQVGPSAGQEQACIVCSQTPKRNSQEPSWPFRVRWPSQGFSDRTCDGHPGAPFWVIISGYAGRTSPQHRLDFCLWARPREQPGSRMTCWWKKPAWSKGRTWTWPSQ